MRVALFTLLGGLLSALSPGCALPDETGAIEIDLELPAHFPEPEVPADNPLSAASVELGRHLFYDPRLSGTGTVSCNTCHKQERAFSDDRALSVGVDGQEGTLNAPSLANAIYLRTLTWSHADLDRIEEQLLGPMFGEDPLEMGMHGAEGEIIDRLRADPRYFDLFDAAFPGQAIELDNARLALASFVRSLVSGSSPFDEFLSGDTSAISASARRGSELFYSSRLGCGSCHAGFALTTAAPVAGTLTAFHNTGLYNLDGAGAYPEKARGLIEDTGLDNDMGRFRVPSLRNVALTGPYGHDGSIATLEEVLRIYEAGGREIAEGPYRGDGRASPLRSEELRSFELSDEERGDLLAFLQSLSDSSFTSDPRHANPW